MFVVFADGTAATEAARQRVLEAPMSELEASLHLTTAPVTPTVVDHSLYSIFASNRPVGTPGEAKENSTRPTPVVVSRLPQPTPIQPARSLFSPSDIDRPSMLVKGTYQHILGAVRDDLCSLFPPLVRLQSTYEVVISR